MGPLPVAAYCAKKPKMASLCTNSGVLSVRSGSDAPRLGCTGRWSMQKQRKCSKLWLGAGLRAAQSMQEQQICSELSAASCLQLTWPTARS